MVLCPGKVKSLDFTSFAKPVIKKAVALFEVNLRMKALSRQLQTAAKGCFAKAAVASATTLAWAG